MAYRDVSGYFLLRIHRHFNTCAHFTPLKPAKETVLKIGKRLLLIGALAVNGGCADYVLISYRPGGCPAPEDQWHELKDCREPEGPVEEAVVEAAKRKSFVKVGTVTATCLFADGKQQLVVAAVGNSTDSATMAPKCLTNYRVVDGKIDAFSETVTEPSPDPDYEKTIFTAAMRARTNMDKSVIIYTRPDKELTVAAHVEGGCVITVRVREGFSPTGELISERRVNVCNEKAGNDGGLLLPRGRLQPGRQMR